MTAWSAAWSGKALGQLSADQRQVIALAYLGGYTQTEVSSITGLPLGTVKSRTFAGHQTPAGPAVLAGRRHDDELDGGAVMDAVRCPHQENAVGWALYALEPAEEHAVRAHLRTCAECRRDRAGDRTGRRLAGHTRSRNMSRPRHCAARLLAAIDDTSRPSSRRLCRSTSLVDAATSWPWTAGRGRGGR